LRGQERGDNKHRNTRPGIPAEKEKHKLSYIKSFTCEEKKFYSEFNRESVKRS